MIVRVERRLRFTCVDNHALEDARLSFRALGLLVYLLSKSSDWSVHIKQLTETHVEGREAVRHAMQELEVAGYAQRRKGNDPDTGQLRWECVIYEQPIAQESDTDAQEPDVGLPDAQEPAPTKEGSTKDGTTKEKTPPSTVVDKRADPGYRFEDFWTSYPQRQGRRVGRTKALERWKRLSYDDKAAAFRGVTHYRADCDAERTIAKDAERWLRDRCWEDWQDEAKPTRTLAKQERRLIDSGLVAGYLEACDPNSNGQPAITTTGQVTT